MNDTAPIMLLFFVREDSLKKQFETVRKAKPSKLLLVQDGPRNEDDKERILRCRKIVEDVDWDCQVLKNYSTVNLGAHQRIWTGLEWAFSDKGADVDRLIYLEDDLLPTQSFYRFCSDMLEMYKDDKRIMGIAGASRMGEYEGYQYDAVFSRICFTGLGWATWKRSWNLVHDSYNTTWYLDEYFLRKLVGFQKNDIAHGIYRSTKKWNKDIDAMVADIIRYKETGEMLCWHNPFWITNCINELYSIFPKKNYVKYMGVDEDATTSGDDLRFVPHKIRKIFELEAYDDLNQNILVPPYVLRDLQFDNFCRKKTKSYGIANIIEIIWLHLKYGDWRWFVSTPKRWMKRSVK
ncbi:hypothetical protein [Pseudobutyrivibrio xylanivorans]|uniref:Hemolysin activation protein n=1 Tax=Pseudobutyrivibrio xylanivorans TaxID=185007 RepID=A0A1G5S4Y2_PSEXY|nr:hypothetical protein [Pseudobutyrivibrio xylanivorans]SCZ81228.1 hypothetical protein SAMN02910350_02701 [Pseudobutyrivibrio xylanivorans]